MNAFHCILKVAFAALALGIQGPLLAQGDLDSGPEAEFLRAYMLAQRAERFEKEGRLSEALQGYRATAEILSRLATQNPEWQTMVVEYRTRRTLASIGRLQKQLESIPLPEATGELPVRDPGMASTMPEDFATGDQRYTELQARIRELQRRLELSETSREELKRQVDAGSSQIRSLGRELEAAKGREKTLREQIDALRMAQGVTPEEIASLNQKLEETTQERDRLVEAISQLPGEEGMDPIARVVALQAKFEETTRENNELTARINELMSGSGEQDALALRSEIVRLNEDITRLQLEADAYKTTIAELQEQVETTSAELAEIRLSGVTPSEVERLTGENELLKDILRTQLKSHARRDQARQMVLAELQRLEITSEEIAKQLEVLAEPVTDLTDEQRAQLSALLREPVVEPGALESDLAVTVAASSEPEPASGPPSEPQMPSGPAGEGTTTAEVAEEQPEKAPQEERQPFRPPVPEELMELAREARSKFQARDYKEAERLYDNLLAKAPNNVHALSNLGVVYFHTGRLRAAEMVLRKAVNVSPTDAFAYQTLGIVHFRQGRYDDAMAALTKSLDINPKNAVAHNYLGITASKKGWPEAAEKEILEAIRLNPSYPDAHFNLAVVYAMNEPPTLELARKHYTRSLELGAPPDKALERLLKLAGDEE